MPKMTPKYNLNGTSPAELMALSVGAHAALKDALVAMGRACPHGRDYQGAEPGVCEADRAEYSRRVNMIQELMGLYHEEALDADRA